MQEVQPDEVYNLAAQSHVQVSFESPEYTANVDALGTLRLLEAIRMLGLEKKTRFYQASTSELFGKVQEIPQTEKTPFYPRSPYACAKLYSYWITVNYREAYGMYACNGILFNHESPVRGETFVTRKITRALSRILLGLSSCLYLGNMNAKRDWGHARDYVEMQWLMLQQEQPDDFVIATGRQFSVRDFVNAAAAELGLSLEWKGEGLDETATVKSIDADKATLAAQGKALTIRVKEGDTIVRVDPRYFRPTEVETLLGDPAKAQVKLGWKPRTTFEEMVQEMARHDLELALRRAGYENLCVRSHAELDLTEQQAVRDFFAAEKPDYVILAAAKVGGIHANATYPAQFIYENLQIQNNVIHSAWQYCVKKFLFLGSSCIYPKLCPQPIKEEYLLTGALEPTNDAYALAKISGIKMCQAYRKQYGFDAVSAMPTNLYGTGDNYHPEDSHVIPAMIRRFHEAKIRGLSQVSIWGTGTPLREFLHADDMADACVFLLENYSDFEHVNVGSQQEMTIMDIARLVARVVGYEGQILTDPSKPDGTPRKLMDSGRLFGMGWQPRIGLEEGLRAAYADFLTSVAE